MWGGVSIVDPREVTGRTDNRKRTDSTPLAQGDEIDVKDRYLKIFNLY